MVRSFRGVVSRFVRAFGLTAVVCVLAVEAPKEAVAAPLEFTCGEAGVVLFADREALKAPIYDQAVGVTSMLRNLLCFVGDTRCSCLREVGDGADPRYEEFKIELARTVGRCNGEDPDRSLSGAVQEAVFEVCKTRRTCIDERAVDPGAICPRVVDPVCGCDGRQYGNTCEAQKAGLTSWADGPCAGTCIDPNSIDASAVCPRVFDPVCGCDDRTYSNSCEARSSGVTSSDEGACGDECFDPSRADPGAVCPSVFDPVCGCDDEEYSNSCEASKSGITFWTSGGCGEECIDPSKIDPGAICPLAIDPVCGCDGKEYQNSCRASSAGLTSWSDGSCSR